MLAAVALAERLDEVTSPTRRKRPIRAAMGDVSEYLGNTPTVARGSYVDPRLIDAYEAGTTIAPTLRRLGNRRRAPRRRATRSSGPSCGSCADLQLASAPHARAEPAGMTTQDVCPPRTARPPPGPRPPVGAPSATFAVVAGLVTAGVALGVAELLAGLDRTWRSPVLDVGDRLIDAAPPFVKEFAIETFGTNDKPALLIGIGVVPRRLRGRRRHRRLAPPARARRRRHRPVRRHRRLGVVEPAGRDALARRAPERARRRSPASRALVAHRPIVASSTGATMPSARCDGATGRRQFLHRSGRARRLWRRCRPPSARSAGRLGQRFTATESRAAVRLPAAGERLAALPAGVMVEAPA